VQILILGGTVFLGRHIVDAARAAGHEVTLFNRGQSNPSLFSELERITGDRTASLEPLLGRRWDAVVDVAGYLPRVVHASAEQLATQIDHYTFISTISVFAGFAARGMNESSPLGELAGHGIESVTGETYGPLKAACEKVVADTLPGRALIIRPGLIVGPHDPTDRFTYWPHRITQGGEVLAPGRPEGEVQFVDARDLAAWTVRLIEQRTAGVFNATGPAAPLTMGDFLNTCATVANSSARFTFAGEPFLRDAGISPWSDMPLWIGDDPSMAGFAAVDCSRARAAGLAFRPLENTVRDTLAWDATREQVPLRAGISLEREAEILRAWHAAR
jgi:2'-hydroxyisoflavone reductase